MTLFRFVDGEIGIRNLADTFRYDELPNIIKALHLAEKRARNDHCTYEELEEYEKLAILVSLPDRPCYLVS